MRHLSKRSKNKGKKHNPGKGEMSVEYEYSREGNMLMD